MKVLLHFLTGALVIAASGGAFRVAEVENREVVLVKSGGKVTLTCKSDEKFNTCRWGRPGSATCGVFSTDPSLIKECPPLAPDSATKPGLHGAEWKIEKVAAAKDHEDFRTCLLTLTNVKEGIDEGAWHCDLQGYPDQDLPDQSYPSDQNYFDLEVLKPAKVVLDGPAVLPLQLDTSEALTCSAESPQGRSPAKLEWFLDEQPLTWAKMEKDSSLTTLGEGSGKLLKERISAIFPAKDHPDPAGEQGHRLECRATVLDDANATVVSRLVLDNPRFILVHFRDHSIFLEFSATGEQSSLRVRRGRGPRPPWRGSGRAISRSCPGTRDPGTGPPVRARGSSS